MRPNLGTAKAGSLGGVQVRVRVADVLGLNLHDLIAKYKRPRVVGPPHNLTVALLFALEAGRVRREHGYSTN